MRRLHRREPWCPWHGKKNKFEKHESDEVFFTTENLVGARLTVS
jgi:hypothetical protein